MSGSEGHKSDFRLSAHALCVAGCLHNGEAELLTHRADSSVTSEQSPQRRETNILQQQSSRYSKARSVYQTAVEQARRKLAEMWRLRSLCQQ